MLLALQLQLNLAAAVAAPEVVVAAPAGNYSPGALAWLRGEGNRTAEVRLTPLRSVRQRIGRAVGRGARVDIPKPQPVAVPRALLTRNHRVGPAQAYGAALARPRVVAAPATTARATAHGIRNPSDAELLAIAAAMASL